MNEPRADDALERLAALKRAEARQATTEVQRQLSRQRFLSRLDGLGAESRLAAWRWAAPLVGAVCLAFVLFYLRTPALTFEVRGAELSGKYVSAPETHPAELRFSDASTLVAAAGSRLRVEETSVRGARVLLERGRASVHVVHEGSTAWTFGAGPFEVRVTGTRFELGWDPTSETCDLLLREGSVEVRGLADSGPVVVRAGQRFQGDARRRTMQVLAVETPLSPAPSTTAAPFETPPSTAPLPSASAPRVVTTPPPGDRGPRSVSWADMVAGGRFKEVVSDAEARGVGACLASCSASELRALSDAARYTAAGELAERSLTALRRRFPGPPASEAGFLLGRLHERRGAHETALTFYDSYLRESPSGPFAAEALAGKLRAVRATRGRVAAEPLARDYLRRFPKGVHVSTAREILDSK